MHFGYKSVLAALLILGLSALSLGQAGGAGSQPAPAAPPPTKLAVVNIVDLFGGLFEKKAGDDAIETLKKGFEEESVKRQKEISDLEKGLGLFTPGTEDYRRAQDDLLKKTMDLQVFGNYAQQRLFIELRVRTAGLYRKINDSVAKYAAANGIALVFVADNSNMDKATSQEMLMSMITTRKILYFHPDFDLTAKIKQVMNTEYSLGSAGKAGG
jgi:Skp family chaperone for outer membrane proteins